MTNRVFGWLRCGVRSPAFARGPQLGLQGCGCAVRAPQPNQRLKLAAPGLGSIPFVPQRTCVSGSITGAPAALGRRSLSAVR
jgi:hypothetical protein